jgi:TonB family protein
MIPYHVHQDELQLLLQVDPVAPPIKNWERLNGSVLLRVIINEKGEIRTAEVVRGDAPLRASALQAVLKWRYKPWLVEGSPVAVESLVTVKFLTEDSARTTNSSPARDPMRTGGNFSSFPRLSKRVEPIYPETALKERISGSVIVELTVNEEGLVYEARVLRGHRLLNRAALDAVLQWEYFPLRVRGEAMPFLAAVTLIFTPPK